MRGCLDANKLKIIGWNFKISGCVVAHPHYEVAPSLNKYYGFVLKDNYVMVDNSNICFKIHLRDHNDINVRINFVVEV